MTIEELRELYRQACERVQTTAAAVDALGDDATPEQIRAASDANALAVTEADQAKAAVDERVADDERQAAIQRGREAHRTPNPGTPPVDPAAAARARGAATEEAVYRPDQRGFENQGYFHDLALAKGGDPSARDRLIRNNRQAIEAALNDEHRADRARDGLEHRAGDLTTATHMGEFVMPNWTNELYAALLRAGRPVADQCLNNGDPTSTVWSLPRITTGSTAAVQTEGSALSNTDHVSDSISAALKTIGGYNTASYQLVELAQPGMDQVIMKDLLGAINTAVDNEVLNGTATNGKGIIQLSGINSVTFTASTPTVALLWPMIHQGNVAIAKGIYDGADFIGMHPSTWFWMLSALDSQSRPLFLNTDAPAFNNLGSFNGQVQGLAGNIDGIPVILDTQIPVNTGAGTNQATVLLINRGELLVKEGAPRFVATPIVGVTSLMWNFVGYKYFQQMFGRHPKAFSAITGTGLVVQSGY